MSIYDIWHGHVQVIPLRMRGAAIQIAPIFFASSCIYIEWWHSCLETNYQIYIQSLPACVIYLVCIVSPSLSFTALIFVGNSHAS